MSYMARKNLNREETEQLEVQAKHVQANGAGQLVSPNTGKVIDDGTKTHKGHRYGFENKHDIEFSEKAGLSQEEHNKLFGNPAIFQIEPAEENLSHQFECKDKNEAMQNISAYACGEDPDIAARTYINPSADHNSNTISIVNAQTGEEETLSSYSINASENAVENTASVAEESTYTAAEMASNEMIDADGDDNVDAEIDAYEDAYTL